MVLGGDGRCNGYKLHVCKTYLKYIEPRVQKLYPYGIPWGSQMICDPLLYEFVYNSPKTSKLLHRLSWGNTPYYQMVCLACFLNLLIVFFFLLIGENSQRTARNAAGPTQHYWLLRSFTRRYIKVPSAAAAVVFFPFSDNRRACLPFRVDRPHRATVLLVLPLASPCPQPCVSRSCVRVCA